MDGWVGRSSVFGTLGCGPGGLQGGIRRYKTGPSRASIDEVSRKEKKKNSQDAELIMAAAAMHVRGPRLIRHMYIPDPSVQ